MGRVSPIAPSPWSWSALLLSLSLRLALGTGSVAVAHAATNPPAPASVLEVLHRLPSATGKERILRRSELEAMKTGAAGARPAFRAVLPNAWWRGLVPIYAVDLESRIELRRLPGRGQENFSEPLFFAWPNEDEADEVLKISGRWEVKAIRGDKSPAVFAWELASEGGRVAGRFEQLTDFRFAYLNPGSFRSNRLEFIVEYISDRYIVRGEWKDNRLTGQWRRSDEGELGTWEATRDPAVPPPLPVREAVPLHEWRRATDNARYYGAEADPSGPGWSRTPRPLGRVWRLAADPGR